MRRLEEVPRRQTPRDLLACSWRTSVCAALAGPGLFCRRASRCRTPARDQSRCPLPHQHGGASLASLPPACLCPTLPCRCGWSCRRRCRCAGPAARAAERHWRRQPGERQPGKLRRQGGRGHAGAGGRRSGCARCAADQPALQAAAARAAGSVGLSRQGRHDSRAPRWHTLFAAGWVVPHFPPSFAPSFFLCLPLPLDRTTHT